MILASAQCVQFMYPNQLKVFTKSAERNPFNVTKIYIHENYRPANLTNDVALLQLNGSTIVAPTLIDNNQAHTTHCQAKYAHGLVSLNGMFLNGSCLILFNDLTACQLLQHLQLLCAAICQLKIVHQLYD